MKNFKNGTAATNQQRRDVNEIKQDSERSKKTKSLALEPLSASQHTLIYANLIKKVLGKCLRLVAVIELSCNEIF